MLILYFLIILIPFAQYPPFYAFTGGVSLIKLIGIGALIWAVFHKSKSAHKSSFGLTQQKFVLLLFVYCVILLLVEQGGIASSGMQRLLSFIIYFFLCTILLDSVKKIRYVLYCIVVGMMLASFRGMKEVLLLGYGRPSSVFGDPNYFAMALVLAIPITFWAVGYHQVFKQRIICLSALFGLSGTLLLTGSRGGILGFGFTMVFAVFIAKTRAKAVLAIVIISVVLMPFAPSLVHERFKTMKAGMQPGAETVEGSAKSVLTRLELMRSGWRMIKEHPFLGVGLNKFKTVSVEYNRRLHKPQIAHCTWIEIAAELGVPALIILLSIIFLCMRDLRRMLHAARRIRDRELEFVVLSLYTGFWGYLVAATFLSAQWEKFFWQIIFTSIALKNCFDSAAARRPEEAFAGVGAVMEGKLSSAPR
jgi:O-antigen ligase